MSELLIFPLSNDREIDFTEDLPFEPFSAQGVSRLPVWYSQPHLSLAEVTALLLCLFEFAEF